MPNKNNKILFFCPIPPPLGGQALISKIIVDHIKPKYIIDTSTKNKYLDNIKVIWKSIIMLVFRKIDLVYFTCTRSKSGAIKDIVLLLLCRLRKIKVINHLHGNELMDLFDGGIISSIILWSYSSIHTTIFVTNRQKQLMPASLSKMKRIVIPNCYDPIFHNIEVDFIRNNDKIGVLFISFLMKSKGILIALEVFELIAEKYKYVTFDIAGQPLGDYLMSEKEIKVAFFSKFNILENKYPNRFFYHGAVNGLKKINLFVQNDILLFPTFFKTESFGIVNVEAMRTGNAVVTTDHNFMTDIVTREEGILVPTNDVEKTFAAIEYLLENKSILWNIQKHNVEHAKNHYSPVKFINEIEKVFS